MWVTLANGSTIPLLVEYYDVILVVLNVVVLVFAIAVLFFAITLLLFYPWVHSCTLLVASLAEAFVFYENNLFFFCALLDLPHCLPAPLLAKQSTYVVENCVLSYAGFNDICVFRLGYMACFEYFIGLQIANDGGDNDNGNGVEPTLILCYLCKIVIFLFSFYDVGDKLLSFVKFQNRI